MPVLVEVLGGDVAGFGDGDQRESESVLGDADGPLQEFQIFGLRALVEEVKFVVAGGNVGDGEFAAGGRRGKPGRLQNGDNCAHCGVNIAKNAHNSGNFERLKAICAGRIEAGVESLPAEIREGVVVNRVEIGEIDGAADGDGEDVRGEVAVLLLHDLVPRQGGGGGPSDRPQPD